MRLMLPKNGGMALATCTGLIKSIVYIFTWCTVFGHCPAICYYSETSKIRTHQHHCKPSCYWTRGVLILEVFYVHVNVRDYISVVSFTRGFTVYADTHSHFMQRLEHTRHTGHPPHPQYPARTVAYLIPSHTCTVCRMGQST